MARIFWASVALLALPALAGPQTVQLDVQKMTCATCPITVRLALRKVAGVIDAKVTLEPPAAIVTYDDAKTDPGELTRATTNAGFPSSVRKQP